MAAFESALTVPPPGHPAWRRLSADSAALCPGEGSSVIDHSGGGHGARARTGLNYVQLPDRLVYLAGQTNLVRGEPQTLRHPAGGCDAVEQRLHLGGRKLSQFRGEAKHGPRATPDPNREAGHCFSPGGELLYDQLDALRDRFYPAFQRATDIGEERRNDVEDAFPHRQPFAGEDVLARDSFIDAKESPGAREWKDIILDEVGRCI